MVLAGVVCVRNLMARKRESEELDDVGEDCDDAHHDQEHNCQPHDLFRQPEHNFLASNPQSARSVVATTPYMLAMYVRPSYTKMS